MSKLKIANKDNTIKRAEIKVLVICICYVILGLALTYICS